MLNIAKTQKYLDFMHWLQNTFPGLYAGYWKCIDVVNDEEELKVSIPNADEYTQAKIASLQKSYFASSKSSCF